jgi:hypothetical protein
MLFSEGVFETAGRLRLPARPAGKSRNAIPRSCQNRIFAANWKLRSGSAFPYRCLRQHRGATEGTPMGPTSSDITALLKAKYARRQEKGCMFQAIQPSSNTINTIQNRPFLDMPIEILMMHASNDSEGCSQDDIIELSLSLKMTAAHT